jgi:multiple sugar transport system permease protein
MTGGGPNGSTTTIIYYIFNNAFEWYRMGYAAAISWVLFLIIFAVTVVKWRFFGKAVHYT